MSGVMAVFWKELSDHFTSKRFIILFLLIYLAGIATIYMASQNIRSEVTDTTELIFLKLFTISGENLSFSLPFFLSLFVPIVGIALGFDAINSERTSGNLSRILSQPIYRDSVINGKFLAGVATIAVLVISIVAVVAGLGIRMIGVPPNAEEVLRLFVFIFLSVLYGSFWLSLSILFSILFKRTATSVLSSVALWVFLFIFISTIARLIAGAIVPVEQNSAVATVVQNDAIIRMISRISPGTLYGEAVQVVLMPEMGDPSALLMLISISAGMVPGSLPLSQSLVIVWPQLTSLIALTAICFVISYIKFMREEIRST
jgi:ABC-2 type transport system permease protein